MKRFQGKLWWIALAGVLAVETFVFAWTRPDTKRWASVPLLALELEPALFAGEATGGNGIAGQGYRYLDQPERLGGAVEQLSFARGVCGVFHPLEENSRRALDFFYFEYEAGNPRFIHDVFGHAPEVCMRAIGATLQRQHPSRSIEADGSAAIVRVLEFRSPVAAGPLWVFHLTWLPEDAPFQASESASDLRREKLLSGLFGNPNPPARILLAGAVGYESLEEAWASFETQLVSRLRVGG